MKWLTNEVIFPDVATSSPEGVLAFGGDLSPDRLILAYKSGIFPWYNSDEPIIWWSPNPRMVLFLDDIKISKSMQKVIKSQTFKVTFNQNFSEVISKCQKSIRKDQNDTWISSDMIAAYNKLHQLGFAKSVEVWQNDKLVGGLYGIDLGNVFCGESMFSTVSNASKIAFIALAQKLKAENYQLLDCQVYNAHLASLGCEEIDRNSFLKILKNIMI
jgi:leucyl/phenylalanyl-tRNA--protein transferase